MDEPVASQLFLYDDCAAEVYFTDGSSMQLSPCASSFLHVQSPADVHPLQGSAEIQQRSEFVTSAFREKLLLAIDFRNRFASPPYLCRTLIEPNLIVKLHADIFEVSWPAKLLADTVTTDGCRIGTLTVSSVDGHASVALADNRQHFTVRYLAKVSQPLSKRNEEAFHKPTVDQPTNALPDKHSQRNSSSIASILSGNSRWDYVWLVQHHSTQMIPDCWKHPVQLLLAYSEGQNSMHGEYHDSNKDGQRSRLPENGLQCGNENPCQSSRDHKRLGGEKQQCPSMEQKQCQSSGDNNQCQSSQNQKQCPLSDHKQCQSSGDNTRHQSSADQKQCQSSIPPQKHGGFITSPLPRALPLTCSSAHLHRWRGKPHGGEVYQGQRAHVICLQGVIYRVVKNTSDAVVAMEIYPGDGSMMRSHGLVGHFYKHFIICDNKLEERMYALQCLPPHVPGVAYSIAKLVERATNLLQQAQDLTLLTLNERDVCCWKARSVELKASAPVTDLLEECDSSQFGRFSAHSNGHVRVVFPDRTCLDMWADFSKRLKSTTAEPVGVIISDDLPVGTCKLLLPSGHYHMVKTAEPGEYRRYVQAAVDWIEWVNCTSKERCRYYKNAFYADTEQPLVQAELKKINCFNYLTEHKLKPTIGRQSQPTAERATVAEHADESNMTMDFSMVQQVLEKTTSAVRELDAFLQSAKTDH